MENETMNALATQAASISELQQKIAHLEFIVHHLKEWSFKVSHATGNEPPEFDEEE